MKHAILLSMAFFAITASSEAMAQEKNKPNNSPDNGYVFTLSAEDAAKLGKPPTVAAPAAKADGSVASQPSASGKNPDDEDEEDLGPDGKPDPKRQRARGFMYAGAGAVASPRLVSQAAPAGMVTFGYSQTGQNAGVSLMGAGRAATDGFAFDAQAGGLRSGANNSKKSQWALALNGHIYYGDAGGYLANAAVTGERVFRVNSQCRAVLGAGLGGTASDILGAGKSDFTAPTNAAGIAVNTGGGCHYGPMSIDANMFVIMNSLRKDGDHDNATNVSGGAQFNAKYALSDDFALIANASVDGEGRSAREGVNGGVFTNYNASLGFLYTFGHSNSNAPKVVESKDNESEGSSSK